MVALCQNRMELCSFEQFWEMTVRQNPTLAIYKHNTEIARYNYRASLSYVMPTVLITINAQDNFKEATTVIEGNTKGNPTETFFARLGTKYNYTTAITVNYTLFDWQKITAAKQAQNNIKLKDSQEAYYRQTLKNQAALLYYQTLVSVQALSITEQDIILADSLVKIARNKYKEGVLALTALNQAKINYYQIAQNVIKSQNLYQNNIHELRILLGIRMSDTIVFRERLPERIQKETYGLGKDKLLDTYLFLIKDALYNLKNQRRIYVPKLSFNVYYGFDQFQDELSAFSFKSSAWHQHQYVGLSLSLPLFSGLGNMNRSKVAHTNLDLVYKQAAIAIEQSRINDNLLIGEIERKYLATQQAFEAFKLYGENLNMYKIEYDEGAIDINTLLIYFQDYLISENAYLGQLSDYYNDLCVIISRN